MSYQQCWLDDNYDYIRSVKMIIIHILIMVVAILGVYGSTQIFPSLYWSNYLLWNIKNHIINLFIWRWSINQSTSK